MNFDLKLGFYCNHNCVHCAVSDSSQYGNLSFDQIRQIISKISCEYNITLTGGEPTLRPDFYKILGVCEIFRQINIQTNGTGITENLCKRLRQYRINILLTIHSNDKDTYIKTARCDNSSFDKAIEAAKLLTKYNINFIWQVVVHKLNKDTVFDTFLYAKSINNKVDLKLTYPDPCGNADNPDLLCSYTDLQELIENVTQEFPNSLSYEGFPLCLIQKHSKSLYNSSQGEEAKGIDFNNNLSITSYKMNERMVYIEICNNCLYKSRCHGIYKKYIDYFGDKEFNAIRSVLPAKKNFMYNYFFLWIFMTTKCNCNCNYCKQKTLIKDQSMSEDNLRYILDECIKIHNKGIVNRFSFELSGGEPFIAFNMFSRIISEYKLKYSNIFDFCNTTNATIINDDILKWVKSNFNNSMCVSIDGLTFSKPMNGISSSQKQLENVEMIKSAGIKVACISVFDIQSPEEMLTLAEYAVKNFTHWRVLIKKPTTHIKDEIVTMAKPVLKYLYEHNYTKHFDFDSWDLWNRKNVAGCPCGRRLLGVLPDLEVIPNNGEEIIKLGKFNSDLISIINNPANAYYREDLRPNICKECELIQECDGECRSDHKDPTMMKERCDAIKELFVYVQTLKK
ncbi:MAG: radical SAM protein [Bacteroidales bacterium]|nr:radical SAM protein [Bacteroidales bacterium]